MLLAYIYAGRKSRVNEFVIRNLKFEMEKKWRRGQDSNLQALTRGSFQDYCLSQLGYLSAAVQRTKNILKTRAINK